MQTVAEYLDKTESAVKKLFDGIDSYRFVLRGNPEFASSYSQDEDPLDLNDRWASENPEKLKASLDAQRSFIAESFALATLCGGVLQIAAKAIECYPVAIALPDDWVELMSGKAYRSLDLFASVDVCMMFRSG